MVSLLAAGILLAPSILIEGGWVYDGSGSPKRRIDVRIQGGRIAEVGRLAKKPGEIVLEARGLAVSPGFIDAHSHANSGILDHPDAESQVRQGITTAIAGQDGGWPKPVRDQMREIAGAKPAINFALFSGHGGIRGKVMGKDSEREATPAEVEAMRALVEDDMKAGALGLSSGLEYNPGHFASKAELTTLAKEVAKSGGMYISHVRDETNGVFDSFQELIDIARVARLPAQISHIKMAVASMWGRADDALKMIDQANRAGLDVTADVYPYLYWQSTITVLTVSRDWGSRKVWEDGLRDVGGAANVRLTRFSPDPSWEGLTLAQLSSKTGRDPVSLIMDIIDRTRDGKGSESIVCTSMTEADLKRFLRHPKVMFCSDGSIGGSHPRGAGAFPRILGRYVHELKVLSLEEAIRKMTSLPAKQFGLRDRGLLRKGMAADVVVFDPSRIRDKATPENPGSFAVGMVHVLVNGQPVIRAGRLTNQRSGRILRREAKRG